MRVLALLLLAAIAGCGSDTGELDSRANVVNKPVPVGSPTPENYGPLPTKPSKEDCDDR